MKSAPLIVLRGTENICIHSPLHLGDSVMSIPFVQNLKNRFPKIKITIIAKKELAALWHNQPYIYKIQQCASTPKELLKLSRWLKKEQFAMSFLLATGEDVAQAHYEANVPLRIGFDFWNRGRFLTHPIPTAGYPTDPKLTRKHMVRNYLDLLKQTSIQPKFFHPKILKMKNEKPEPNIIGIAPGAAFGPSKRWPAESYRALILKFSKIFRGEIALFGSTEDRVLLKHAFNRFAAKRIVNRMGQTNLDELMEWILKCKLIIANDSGISHLANALGVPTITLFGSSSPVWTGPLDPRSNAIASDLPCSPCFQATCPLGHTRCLREISVNTVLSQITRRL